jgi:hypothetical protein
MSNETLEILNPKINARYYDFLDGNNYVRRNQSSDVSKHINTGYKYVLEFPRSKRFVNVLCISCENNSCHFKILSTFIDGVQNFDDDNYILPYIYENFDKIYYSSLVDREYCVLYSSINDLY